MSDFVVHKGRREQGSFVRHYGSQVTHVHYEHREKTAVMLADGRSGIGSCLGCGNAPCMEKNISELALFGSLDAFPGDPSREVCPTKAIKWDQEKSVAIVTSDECIGCGLCISRCPYGAISLVNGLFAHVEINDPDKLTVVGTLISEHPTVIRKGHIATLDAPAAANILSNVRALSDIQTTLLVRNLLNEVGLNARTRRRGDTNMRIDVVGFSRRERPFVAEIETSVGVLESPRALLEDIAILHSRYGYAVEKIDPISIILVFPNIRSEYYQVIRDIEKVLGIRCRSLTIGALIAMLWNFHKLQGFNGENFAINNEIIDLTNSLEMKEKKLPEPYPGAFTPAK